VPAYQAAVGRFLRVSFQRYPRPARDLVDGRPASWGALPVMGSEGAFTIPVADDEAVWLGLTAVRPEVIVACRVAAAAATLIDAVSGEPWSDEVREHPPNFLQVPPAGSIDGVWQAHGLVPFAFGSGRGGISGLHIVAIPSRRMKSCIRQEGTAPLRVPIDNGAISPPPTAPMHGPWRVEHSATARVRFASHRSFEQRTGCRRPPPLDPDSVYKGWRLP
jgi:hypothetical protein